MVSPAAISAKPTAADTTGTGTGKADLATGATSASALASR